jgi:hypothetical protein
MSITVIYHAMSLTVLYKTAILDKTAGFKGVLFKQVSIILKPVKIEHPIYYYSSVDIFTPVYRGQIYWFDVCPV